MKKISNGTHLSIVLPVFNEEEALPTTMKELYSVCNSLNKNYEIIFVDDCSRDRTPEILNEFVVKDPRIKVLRFSRNFGHSQYGFTAGTEYATGDAVVWTDADLQDPPEVIEEFIKKWQEGYQVVYGVRKKRRGSLFLRIAYKIFYRLLKKLSYLDIPLDAGDFSLLDRKVVEVKFQKISPAPQNAPRTHPKLPPKILNDYILTH